MEPKKRADKEQVLNAVHAVLRTNERIVLAAVYDIPKRQSFTDKIDIVHPDLTAEEVSQGRRKLNSINFGDWLGQCMMLVDVWLDDSITEIEKRKKEDMRKRRKGYLKHYD